MDPLASLDKIFNMVRQEENHKSVMGARDHRYETAVAFPITHPVRANGEQQPGERPACGHCGKTGHDKSTCYELIGYPPGWNTRGERGSRGRGRGGHGGGRFNLGRDKGATSGSGSRRESSYAAQVQGEHSMHATSTQESEVLR